MMKTVKFRPAYNEQDFERDLSELRKGHLPRGMDDLRAYIRCTTREAARYLEALTECAIRQGTQIEMYKTALENAAGRGERKKNG